MNKNYRITAYVNYAGKSNNDSDKNVIILSLTDEQIDRIKKLIGDESKYDATPLKETDDGEILLKLASKFDVDIYDDGVLVDEDDIALANIGKGSKVQCFFSFGDTSYKRKNFKVGYLKSVNILELVESTKFNPFDDAASIEEL